MTFSIGIKISIKMNYRAPVEYLYSGARDFHGGLCKLNVTQVDTECVDMGSMMALLIPCRAAHAIPEININVNVLSWTSYRSLLRLVTTNSIIT